MTVGVVYGLTNDVSPDLLLAVYAPLVPLGYLAAVAGVARARRGDGGVWSWPWFPRRAAVEEARRASFASPARAMSWLEWRRHGFLFPLLVALCVVPHVVLIGFLDRTAKLQSVLGGLVAPPLLMALVAGAALGNCHPSSRRTSAITAFLGARPVTSAEMLAVKLRTALVATLLSWALVALGHVAILSFSHAGGLLSGAVRGLIESQGMKGVVVLALLVVGLPALTWKSLVNQLWIGLSGRDWVGFVWGVTFPVVLTALGLFGAWVYLHPEYHAAFRAAVPWLLGGVLLLRLALGVVVCRALIERRLVSSRAMTRWVTAWVAAAVVLTALAFWLTPTGDVAPLEVAVGAVMLVLPGVRLGLAPLALDWNRHR
jgi:hypothetical protein